MNISGWVLWLISVCGTWPMRVILGLAILTIMAIVAFSTARRATDTGNDKAIRFDGQGLQLLVIVTLLTLLILPISVSIVGGTRGVSSFFYQAFEFLLGL